MEDEIKEILDNMKEISSFEYTTDWFELNYEDTKLLLDYITNLQEENERLEKEQLITNMAYETVLNFYKQRNEKAIEYINKNKHLSMFADCREPEEDWNYDLEINPRELLNILNGGDEE